MIDTSSGIIVGDSGQFSFSEHTTERDLLDSILGKEIINSDHYPAANRYSLQPQLLGGRTVLLFLSFNLQSRLGTIQISVQGDGYPTSWEKWSEQQELNRKAEHDSWLASELGSPPYQYSWGEIESTYDQRTGSSLISVRYYKNRFITK